MLIDHGAGYNPILLVYATYCGFKNLIPDAPTPWQTFLAVELDATLKRNTFVC
jgi:hypothetical protein